MGGQPGPCGQQMRSHAARDSFFMFAKRSHAAWRSFFLTILHSHAGGARFSSDRPHLVGLDWSVWTDLSGPVCLDRSVWIRSVWIRSVWIRSVWVRSVWIPSVWILSGSLQSLFPHPPSQHPRRSPSPSLLSASAGCYVFYCNSYTYPTISYYFL